MAISHPAPPALNPSLLIDQQQPLVLPGYSWAHYLSLDELFQGSGVRVRYLNHYLEIMPPISESHEERKVHLGRIVDFWCMEKGIEQYGQGSATLKIANEAGGKPDESFCFGEKKPVPDLVIEIALTSGGLSKRAFYAKFKVPELWIWRNEKLEIFIYDDTSESGYTASVESHVLKGIDVNAVEECAVLPSITQAVRAFRERI